MKTILSLLASFLIIQSSFAQINRYSQLEGLNFGKESRSDWILESLDLSEDFSLELMKNTASKTSFEHHRFKQYYKGLEVINSQIIIHSESDVIKTAFGNLSTNVDLDIVPTVSASSIEHIVKNKCINNYKIADSDGMEFEMDLSIYEGPRHGPSLVYKVECHDHANHVRHIYIVDASNGVVLEDYNMICGIGVPATGLTTFYGMQNIVVDSLSANQYELRDPDRDIRTLTNINSIDQSIYSEDNTWILDEDNGGTSAIDVHYGSIKTYDYFLENFDFVGMDNAGFPILSVVQLGGGLPFNNAFWNGRNMSYGSGDCNNFPTTSIDVVAHEYMHAVTEFTSGLNYGFPESAGLNEGMSDIFGKAIEYANHSENFDWKMGGKLAKNENGIRIRNLENPWEYENPKYYEGEFYGFGSHNIGSVVGHWYYLLIEGGMYENEVGETYDLTPISRDDAIQIIFNAMTQYALPLSGYRDVASFTKLSAAELFGENSAQLAAISEAWDAVGVVGSGPVINYDLTLDLKLPSIACLTGDPLALEIEVTNLGVTTIPEGTILEFLIESPDQILREYTLLADLNEDERVLIPISDGPILDDPFGFQFITAELLLPDDDSANNFAFDFVNAVGFESLDVSLFVVQLDRFGCGRDAMEFIVEIQNESCNPLEKGTEIELVVYQELTEIYSEILELDKLLYKDEGATYEIDIPYDESIEVLQFTLENPLDVNGDNNISIEEVVIKDEIVDNKLFGFDDALEYQDILYVSNEFIIFPVEYEQETMLVTTGLNTELQPLCPELPDLFDLGNSTQFVKACVDFSDWIEPTLSFDLIQIRNVLFEDEPDHELHNVMKVEWSSPQGNGLEYIYGQPQGEKVFNKFNLPSQFVGEVELSFFHMTGEPFNLMYGDFSIYDITLIDNLRFRDASVSIDEVEDFELSIYPNPASSLLYIDTKLAINNVEVYSTLGQQLLNINGPSKEVDIDDLPVGVYILKLSTDENQIVEKSFVKI